MDPYRGGSSLAKPIMTNTSARSLPHLSPGKIWEALNVKRIWFGLLRAFDHEESNLVVEDACDQLVAHLYKNNYPLHARGENLKGVLATLQSSKLSIRTKVCTTS
jgi:hypothetical protein